MKNTQASNNQELTTKADVSIAKMMKQIEKELDSIREEAKTNNHTFKYQTALWAMYRKIENI